MQFIPFGIDDFGREDVFDDGRDGCVGNYPARYHLAD